MINDFRINMYSWGYCFGHGYASTLNSLLSFLFDLGILVFFSSFFGIVYFLAGEEDDEDGRWARRPE